MKPVELRQKLSGVIAFPITPFRSDLSLDIEGLRENLAKLFAHPICAVVAAGGTGEMYSLSPAEHLRIVSATVEAAAASRVPVIAGVGFNQHLAVELARAATDAGADGILAFPPYFPNADDEGMLAYYRAIGAASNLGTLIYSRDWANFSPLMVERLTDIPNLIGWKDGQGDIRRLQMIRNRVGDRLHWIGGAGDDLVPAYYGIGLRAFTSSVANVSSKVAWQLHETASRGDAAALQALMTTYVGPIYALRAKRRGYEVSVMKSLMDLLGLAGGPVRPPLANLRTEEVDSLRGTVKNWK